MGLPFYFYVINFGEIIKKRSLVRGASIFVFLQKVKKISKNY